MRDADFGNKSTTIGQRRYLGSKTKLISFIDYILEKENVSFNSFADIFAGTGVVADYFHERAHIIVNDILESNYQCYCAFFGKDTIRLSLLLSKLKKYNKLNGSKLTHNYFSKNFANTYFDLPNSKKIGFIRNDIEQTYLKKRINEREKAYLITSLLYALDRIANTVGHYDAYRKIEIPHKKLELRPLDLKKSKFRASIHKQDANDLVDEVKADVVYIDPPYNSRQYSDSYHLLENIASWKKEKVFGVAKKIDRSNLKSKYNLKSAGNAFSELVNKIDANFILISYNNMGTSGNERSQARISDHEIISALQRRGKVTIYEKSYNQFTTGRSTNDDLKERIFFCRVTHNVDLVPSLAVTKHNTHLPTFIKSPLNYTGGKYKLLPQLTKLFPENIKTFYDVFCGGADVGINANADKIVCIDSNSYVIELLQFIQRSNIDELNQNLVRIIKSYGLSLSYINGYSSYSSESSKGVGNYNKNSFLAVRNTYNTTTEHNKIILLLILILYGFNNQIRFNSKGQFNLPVGKRDYNGSSQRKLAHFNAVTNSKNISFSKGDFRELKHKRFSRNDFVYLDPPYLLGLASYNESGGWSLSDEYDLYRTLETLNKRGVQFALSNVLQHKGQANHALIDFAKKNRFKIHSIKHDYHNSNYQSSAKYNITKEVLITNY